MRSVVLVTAIGTAASTTIVSQLSKSGEYHIIGGDIYEKDQVATVKDVDEFYNFPSAIKDLEGYIDFAVDFCRQHNVEYYFATIDEEIANLSKHRARFEEIGVKLCIPNEELVKICHYKDDFFRWIASNFTEIATKTYSSFSEVGKYPVFIKPVEGRASIGCKKIENRSETDELIKNGLNEKEYIIQDFNEGEIVTVDMVRSSGTNKMQQIQRIEKLRNSSGCGIAVEIVDFPKLRDICERLMQALDLNGVVNAEFFYKDDSFRIIEVNPRFSAGTSFSCLAGCDTVTAAVKIAAGQDFESGSPAVGAHLAKRYETYRLD